MNHRSYSIVREAAFLVDKTFELCRRYAFFEVQDYKGTYIEGLIQRYTETPILLEGPPRSLRVVRSYQKAVVDVKSYLPWAHPRNPILTTHAVIASRPLVEQELTTCN